MGDVVSYDYGNKRQWRRWIWNRIAERTESRRDALVLFLAGENAYDIAAAERVGFQKKNMIAVEKDAATLSKLRAQGLLTIEGEFCDVLRTWRHDRKIDVVVADFCCGLEAGIMVGIGSWILQNPAAWSAVLAVNFLRGRDASSNCLRSGLQETSIRGHSISKHRGKAFFYKWLFSFGELLLRHPDEMDMIVETMHRIEYDSLPVFNSYKSTAGTQVFDCAVFKSPLCHVLRNVNSSLLDEIKVGLPDLGLGTAQRRRTAAVLAHRTRNS